MYFYILYAIAASFAASEAKPSDISGTNCNLKCTISLDYKPVCGSNYVTYQNEEELECAKDLCFPQLKQINEGKCSNETTANRIDYTQNLVKPESVTTDINKPTRRTRYRCENCPCPQTLMLVCGSDKNTYQNLCILKCKGFCNQGLTLLHWGKCETE